VVATSRFSLGASVRATPLLAQPASNMGRTEQAMTRTRRMQPGI
jgi:hypothetical protein